VPQTVVTNNYQPVLMLNMPWLEKLGMEAPTTLDAFVEYLRAIKGADMFPDGTSDTGGWLSDTDNAHYAKDYIVGHRSGVADTYTFDKDAVVGTWGTCPWEVDADGTLTIHAGTGEDSDGTSPWYDYRSDIASVKVDGTVKAPASCEGLFAGLTNLRSADLSGLDMSAAESVFGMFSACVALRELDLPLMGDLPDDRCGRAHRLIAEKDWIDRFQRSETMVINHLQNLGILNVVDRLRGLIVIHQNQRSLAYAHQIPA
jgi:hypothetical protein